MQFIDPDVLTEHLQFRIVLGGTAFVIAFASPPRGSTTPGVAHWVVIDEAGERCTCFEAPITSHLPTLEERARSVLRAMLAPDSGATPILPS